MIHVVTGTLGAGKSLYGARLSGRALLQGKAVASNMRFVEGWEYLVLSHSPHYKYARKERKEYMVREIRSRYHYEPDFSKLLSAKLHGYGEGRGVRIFDEAHNEINNREWEAGNQKAMLKRLTVSRKRGWDDYIITQHANNIDVAVRRIADVEVKLVNWRKILRLPVFGTNFLPFNMFLAVGYPVEESANKQVQSTRNKLFSEVFFLGWSKKLYNTMEDYALDDEDAAGVILPHPIQPRVVINGDTLKVGPRDTRHLLRRSAQLHSNQNTKPRHGDPIP